MMIALGLKGNEWAWRHRKWESIEHFKKVQKKWAKASLIFILAMPALFFVMFIGIDNLFKKSEPYTMSFDLVVNSKEVKERLGSPLESGFVWGNISTSGPDGSASLLYSIEGPKTTGSVSLKAIKESNKWHLQCLIVDYDHTNVRTMIKPCT